MIPKIIHYCWFGYNPKPKNVLKCIASWRKTCPDYQIIEWNEDNYSVDSSCEFVREAYKNKMWAFVSDYARLDIIYNHGGIYLDTDVELLKTPNTLIEKGKGYIGFESKTAVNSGLGFAAEKGNTIINEMRIVYHSLKFDIVNPHKIACPVLNTSVLEKYGLLKNNCLQMVGNIQILPEEYLCPENMFTGKICYTSNTISVHHYSGSWMPFHVKIRISFIVKAKRILPHRLVFFLQNVIRKVHLD